MSARVSLLAAIFSFCAAKQFSFRCYPCIMIACVISLHHFNYGFFGLTPLQFLCFGEVPLLFAYSERYHYNSCFVTATPWSTYPMDSGPTAGVYPPSVSRMAHFAPGSRGKGRRASSVFRGRPLSSASSVLPLSLAVVLPKP